MFKYCLFISLFILAGCSTANKTLYRDTASVPTSLEGNLTILIGDATEAKTEKIESIYFNVKDRKFRENMVDIISESKKVCQLSPTLLSEKNISSILIMSFLRGSKSGITCKIPGRSDDVAKDIELSVTN